MTNAHILTETDLFRSYWDDGLLDVLCGLGLLVTGIGWTSGLEALAILQLPLWLTLWGPLRRKIVEPRAGFVRFSLSRQDRTARELKQTLALGVGTLLLLTVAVLLVRSQEAGPVVQRLIPGLPAVLLALGAGLTSLLTGTRRFHLYGLALLAAAALTVLLEGGPALPLLVGGLVVLVSGAVLLTRFLRDSRRYEEAPEP